MPKTKSSQASTPSRIRHRAIRRALRARMYSGVAAILGMLPPKLAATLMGPPAYLVSLGSIGKVATKNLELAFKATWSAKTLRSCQRAVFQHAAQVVSEAAFLSQANEKRRLDWFANNVQVDDSIEHLQAALTKGRGVILATAHLGNWELIPPALVHMGEQGAVVGNFRKRDPSAQWIVRMRERLGVTTLAQDTNPKELLRILKDGHSLGLVCDLEVKRLDGEFTPFFGEPALTMTAPAALARASKAPIVPVRCVKTPDCPECYTILFDSPLEWDCNLPKPEARTRLLTQLNATFEHWIRETPEQWAWYQPRWRVRPGSHQSVPLSERKRRGQPG